MSARIRARASQRTTLHHTARRITPHHAASTPHHTIVRHVRLSSPASLVSASRRSPKPQTLIQTPIHTPTPHNDARTLHHISTTPSHRTHLLKQSPLLDDIRHGLHLDAFRLVDVLERVQRLCVFVLDHADLSGSSGVLCASCFVLRASCGLIMPLGCMPTRCTESG